MTTNTHSSDQQLTAENELREQVEALVLDLWIKYDNGNWFVNEEEDSDGRNNDHRFQDALVDGFMQLFAQAKQAWTVEARINEREGMIFIDEKTGEETQEPFSQYRFVGSGLKLTWSEREAELQTPTAESEAA